jgi:hypothetical protein
MSVAPASAAAERLVTGTHTSPPDLLGAHPARIGNVAGAVVRAFHSDATGWSPTRPTRGATTAGCTERRRREPVREPMVTSEVHLRSWARVSDDGNRSLGFREIAARLDEHIRALGFTPSFDTEPLPWHGLPQSTILPLAPLSALVLELE